MYGLARRGLPHSRSGPGPSTVAAPSRVPGIAATTGFLLHRAFAYSSNIFVRDHGIVSVEDLANVTRSPCHRVPITNSDHPRWIRS